MKELPSEESYFRMLTHQSERLSRLIDNVLDFARIEETKRGFRLEDGDVEEAVYRACELIRAHVERAGFRLGVHVDAGLPRRAFDRDDLTQVSPNLVDNSVKYGCDASYDQVDVSVRREGPRGVVIDVRDRGLGIPQSERSPVFDRFYRINRSGTRKTQWVGLALTIIRGLVIGRRGSVEAVKPPSGRACVRIRL